ERDERACGGGRRARPSEVRMHEASKTALRVCSIDVRLIECWLAVRGAVLSTDEGQCEFTYADHADMTKAATKLFRVLEQVRRCRERRGLAGEVRPPTHQPRAIHMDQRVGDVEVFGRQFQKECLVREPESLMQVVNVRVAGVPAAGWQVDES